jgi:hypothetical protein
LRAFGCYHAEWDAPDIEAPFKEQVNFAVKRIQAGAGPIRLRFALAEEFGQRCQLGRVIQAAYRAIQDADSLPAEVKRAVVAVQRQEAIQGAMADRAWGPALAGLARAGDACGELSEDVGLRPEDLRLVVEVEGDSPPLPAGQEEPMDAIQGEREPIQAECD